MTYTQLDSLLDSYDETKVEQVLLAMEFESDKTILPANYEPPKSYCEAMRRTQEKTKCEEALAKEILALIETDIFACVRPPNGLPGCIGLLPGNEEWHPPLIGPPTITCSGCNRIAYCNHTCRARHWINHSAACNRCPPSRVVTCNSCQLTEALRLASPDRTSNQDVCYHTT